VRLISTIADALLAQRGHLLGWAPVCLGIGIGWYFRMAAEPTTGDYALLAGMGLAALIAARVLWAPLAPVATGIALVLCGVLLAGAKANLVAEPVLGFRYYGPIEGRIVAIDRSVSDAPRLTLDRVVLARMSPERTPARVRVSLHGDQPLALTDPGTVVILTGHLSPPSGPTEPGGFDFQRNAWFDRLGAVGYTRNPVLALAPPEGGTALWVYRQRMAISRAVQASLPGETGAFAAAIMTGDRSGMGQGTLADLRASNLAHLLAISGLHMGLLTGFVFALIRYGLALIPFIALRWPTKKIAAVLALGVGAVYLALSGGNVATERAFIMVAVMLVAVMLDRRALTLRAVAMAAIIVLVLHPEALMGPGFQMSFSATTALVAAFGLLRGRDARWMPRWLRPVGAVFVSSLVAGLATAPFAAAHFNQFSHFGLVANLLSVPLMGVLVMPAAVLASILAPFGLQGLGFWAMDLGLRWILGVAHHVAAIDGAVGHVVAPMPAVLPLLTLGLLWIVLWQGRPRWAGVAPVLLAFGLWGQSGRPALLIADSGALIGVMTPAGRALSKPTGDSFVAQTWLENDGAPVAQDVAGGRAGLTREGRIVRVQIGTLSVLQVSGKTALAALQGCGGADIVVTNMADEVARPCTVYDIVQLRRTGSLAIVEDPDSGPRIVTAREVTGERLWNAVGRPRSRVTKSTETDGGAPAF
jgi:competence protein ComEC